VTAPLFKSPFLGGFECSTHVRRDGRRLDLVDSTRHDRFAARDYRTLRAAGILAARDGLRWHRIEGPAGSYDWSSALPMIRAARNEGIQVAWDLLHFGWPDDVDVFSGAFVERFAAFAGAFTRVLVEETGDPAPFLAPLNEPSFLSFAAGEEGFFFPFAKKRGDEIKRQFVRGIVAASEAILAACPGARLVHTDPIINIAADPRRPQDRMAAELHRQSQFAAWDRIAGRAEPELGGREALLDVIGVNYYIHNQWIHDGELLVPSHPHHLPLRWMLLEVSERYHRPLFVSETGIEADARPAWLRYVAGEVLAARALGADVQGICLYPIFDHPGWEDDRHCPNGLWGYADDEGNRPLDAPYADELKRQQALVAAPLPSREEAFAALTDRVLFDGIEGRKLDVAAHAMEDASRT